MKPDTKKDWRIFFCSVFFVLGFSVVFSLLGVLLQTVLVDVGVQVQGWFGRVAGVFIIFFGIYLLGLIRFPFLEREHKISVKRFSSAYVTSFVFGAAFGTGWTPCVGAVLGAILALAVTQPGSAFFLFLSYSLGLGIPFLAVGLFANQSRGVIARYSSALAVLHRIFGAVLIALGVLVFTSQLSRIANIQFISDFLIASNFGSVALGPSLNMGLAFVAGLVSFASPCVLPLIPAFLSYLASVTVTEK